VSEEAPGAGPELDVSQLALLLDQLGCPSEKTSEMASQLDRRATQLSETTGRSKVEALQHLIGLLRQGWAAKAKGL
jgi:hypothetical protein